MKYALSTPHMIEPALLHADGPRYQNPQQNGPFGLRPVEELQAAGCMHIMDLIRQLKLTVDPRAVADRFAQKTTRFVMDDGRPAGERIASGEFLHEPRQEVLPANRARALLAKQGGMDALTVRDLDKTGLSIGSPDLASYTLQRVAAAIGESPNTRRVMSVLWHIAEDMRRQLASQEVMNRIPTNGPLTRDVKVHGGVGKSRLSPARAMEVLEILGRVMGTSLTGFRRFLKRARRKGEAVEAEVAILKVYEQEINTWGDVPGKQTLTGTTA